MKKTLSFVTALAAILFTAGLAKPSADAQPSPRTIEVTVKRFGFEPSEITLKKGQPAAIVLKSTDVAHGLRFRELNVESKIPAGGSAEMRFTPDKTGDFAGHCSVFCGSGHGGMVLTLHVVE